MRVWTRLYRKVRADIKGSLATGGAATGVLFVLDYAEILTTEPDAKAAIATVAGWVGGKIAAYIKVEDPPIAPTPPVEARV
jgi:hypothetical protein